MGCEKPAASDKPAVPTSAQQASPAPGAGAPAEIGKAAPDFELTSLAGEQVSLSSYKGKTVVLEWFNPQCPFVVQAHTAGTLKGLAKQHQDVVWLAINSGAAGRQGHGADTNRAGKEKFGMSYPILFDEDGRVGQLYGARRTPHMMVIDKGGVLRYRGALDNTSGGDLADVKLVHYLNDALSAVAEGKPVVRAETEAWGCTVKYAKN